MPRSVALKALDANANDATSDALRWSGRFLQG